MGVRVIRYSERPALWDDTDSVSLAVWPEYNLHGDRLNAGPGAAHRGVISRPSVDPVVLQRVGLLRCA